MNKSNDIWVFIESRPDGEIQDVSIELLTPACMLAEKMGGELTAVVIGAQTKLLVSQINRYHLDKIIVVEEPMAVQYPTDVYTDTLEFLIKKYRPSGIIIGATKLGRDFAPRLSCRLDTGLTADCTGIDLDPDSGKIAWTRPTFGGKLMATILCDSDPQMGTVRPGVFTKPPMCSQNTTIVRENSPFVCSERQISILDTIPHAEQENDELKQARVIVAAGRGIRDKAGIELVKELAAALGGTYGATRAVIDQGLMEYNRLIGQTGVSVNPELYIACGVSGALQHTIGIAESTYTVAINSDPDAPIFELANVGIVGNVYEVLPAIINEVKKRNQDVND